VRYRSLHATRLKVRLHDALSLIHCQALVSIFMYVKEGCSHCQGECMCERCSTLDGKFKEQVLHRNVRDIDAIMRLLLLVCLAL
jgi:hypothetical protein